MVRPYFLLFLFLGFFLTLQNPALAQQKSRQEQKTKLIQKAIRQVLEKQDLPTFRLVKNKKKIYILDQMKSLSYPDSAAELLTADMLPDLGETKLILIKEADLPGFYLKKNDLYYLNIGKIDILTPDAGIVDIGGQWIIGKKTRKTGLRQRQAGGQSLLFKREGNGWSEGKVIRNFVYQFIPES